MAEALVRGLIAHFESVFSGPNGDYPAVMESLAGLTAEEAAWKPAPGENSIWKIVEHLTGSKLWEIEMLENGEAQAPAWTDPSGGASAWLASIEKLQQAHAQLIHILEGMSEKDLYKVPPSEAPRTQLELLLSIAAHEAHHCGQIDYLRGLREAK